MAYVSIPKDLKKVKTKVVFNLTSRQLICFSLAAVFGIPVYLLTKSVMGSSIASTLMIVIMLPFFAFAMYERDGLPMEKILRNIIESRFLRPKERPYKTDNFYTAIAQQDKLNQILTDKKLPLGEKKRLVNAIKKAKRDGKISDSAQRTIPYKNMYKDGICQVTDRFYTKTIQFFDINYLLAQREDQAAIFENYCEFLNYFDSSILFQLSFINLSADMEEFQKAIQIPKQKDVPVDIRKEFGGILNDQYTKGNNGLVKTKYITFGVEADNLKAAKVQIERIENDIINNFKTLGVVAKTLNGYDRLRLLHNIFHDGKEKFRFHWDSIYQTGLSTKDFIVPTSFEFPNKDDFRIGKKFGAASYLMLDATELSDRMLADILDTEDNIIVNLHILFFIKWKCNKYKDKNAAPKKENIAKQSVAEVS